MTLSRRDRWLGRYGLVTLNLTAGAIAAHSRDRVARLLGAATLSKGVGYVPPGFQLLMGADGALLKGADGAYLYGKAA